MGHEEQEQAAGSASSLQAVVYVRIMTTLRAPSVEWNGRRLAVVSTPQPAVGRSQGWP